LMRSLIIREEQIEDFSRSYFVIVFSGLLLLNTFIRWGIWGIALSKRNKTCSLKSQE
jgi:hypothetical protein